MTVRHARLTRDCESFAAASSPETTTTTSLFLFSLSSLYFEMIQINIKINFAFTDKKILIYVTQLQNFFPIQSPHAVYKCTI